MIRKSDTFERIVEQAEALFDRFGPTKTTVADIARALQMSPANVYKHFPSKTAIIEVVADRSHALLHARISQAADGPGGAWERLTDVIIIVTRHFRARLQNEKDIIQLHAMAETCRWKFVEQFEGFMGESLVRIIRSGVAEGQLRCDDVAAATAALMDCLATALDPLMLHRMAEASHERRVRNQLLLLEKAFL